MDIIIDANIVMSALIAPEGKTRAVMFLDAMRYFAPEFLLEECRKHKKEIMKKAGLSEEDVDEALGLISLRIRFIPFQEFKGYIQRAREVCADRNDAEYLALALARRAPLWTNDKELHKQAAVKVYSTEELLRELGLV